MNKLYENKYFYDRNYDNRRYIMYRQEFSRIAKKINLKDGGKILDVGCGIGSFLDLFDNKWDKYGVEVSEYATNICSKRNIKISNRVDSTPGKDFDLIIFRGTIQHLPEPLYDIKQCYSLLKDGGMIIFLATPNTNSPVYKLCEDLPMIDARYNYLLFSDKILKLFLVNFGFKDISFYYPYRETPYARPVLDRFKYVLLKFGIKKKADFAFPGNILECYATK